MNKNTNTNQISDAEFCRLMTVLVNEWDRCMAIQISKGLTREQAAAVVSQQATEWLNSK